MDWFWHHYYHEMNLTPAYWITYSTTYSILYLKNLLGFGKELPSDSIESPKAEYFAFRFTL